MFYHFFITGGTGLVGTNLIPRLLLKFTGSTITLLVRGETEADADERIRNIARRIAVEYNIPEATARVDGVLGRKKRRRKKKGPPLKKKMGKRMIKRAS